MLPKPINVILFYDPMVVNMDTNTHYVYKSHIFCTRIRSIRILPSPKTWLQSDMFGFSKEVLTFTYK